jgi:hypothetical protein
MSTLRGESPPEISIVIPSYRPDARLAAILARLHAIVGAPGAGMPHPVSPTPGADRQTPGADGQIPGADRQTPGTDGQTPGADRQTPAADSQAPGTDGQTPARRVEIILVDDGNDRSGAAAIRAAASALPYCRVVRLKRNCGQQRATLAGLRQARGRRIVTMDDDGGHPPELVPRMLNELDRSELVYAAPSAASRRPGPRVRSWGTTANRLIFRLFFGLERCVAVTSFRAFRRSLGVRARVVGARAIDHGRAPNISALLLAHAGRTACVEHGTVRSRASRHTTSSLVRSLAALALYWAPRGLLVRTCGRRLPWRKEPT